MVDLLVYVLVSVCGSDLHIVIVSDKKPTSAPITLKDCATRLSSNPYTLYGEAVSTHLEMDMFETNIRVFVGGRGEL